MVRPMHMALLYSIIANDGTFQKPHVVPQQPKGLIEIALTPKHCQRIKNALHQVVEQGTGRSARIPGLNIAGKTGTADNPHGEPHSWFISFAPVENPSILIAVIVENAGWGSGEAAKITRELYQKTIDLNYLKLSTPGIAPEQNLHSGPKPEESDEKNE